MKKTAIFISIALIGLFILSVTKNIMVKVALTGGVRAITGLKLSIRSINVGIFKTLIDIKGLKLYNPDGFSDKLMADIPEIYVDYKLGPFLRKEIHFEKLKLNLKEFIVVKNEKGEVNLDSLKVVKEKKEKAKPAKEGKKTAFQIDVLELSIGKVIYKDYTAGPIPKVREFDVNIDGRYENINNPRTFANLIIVKALLNTTISNLADFDLGPLTEGLKGTVGTAVNAVSKTADTTKDVVGKAKDTAEEATEKVTETLKGILPFGK
ncbi:MAG: hypothetical protein KJ957_04370 [Candidatus Omnitrophica bacterium]|nr:hypothetical protein [Candidatus Omnitrophota bacterium]